MRWSLTTSFLLHAAILIAALVVLPNPNSFVTNTQPVQVDISKIGDVSKTMATAKDAPVPKDKPAAKKADQVVKAAPADKVAPKEVKAVKEAAAEPPPPPEVKKPDPTPPKPAKADPPPDASALKDLIKDTVDDTPAPKPPDTKPPEKKPDPKPQDKPKKVAEKANKKKAEFNPDEIANLLNKVPDSKAPDATSAIDSSAAKGTKTADGSDNEISATILDAFIQKVKSCWAVPPGAIEANVSVQIHFQLNLDGSINGVPEIASAGSDGLSQATARSAIAALMDCQNYDFLPKDRYELWKDNTLTFNPNMMANG